MQNTIVPSESFKRELNHYLEAALNQTSELTSLRDSKASRTGESIKSLLDDCLEYIRLAHVSEGDQFSNVVFDGMTVIHLVKQSLMAASPEETLRSNVRVQCDPTIVVLRQSSFLAVAISALCQNAIEAVKGKRDANVSVSFSCDGRLGRFLIEDNGSGLPKEVLDRLFPSMFERGQHNDHPRICGGLEEAIRAIRSMGGKIVMKRTGPSGTLFSVSVPIGHFSGPAMRNPLRLAAKGGTFVDAQLGNKARPRLNIVIDKLANAK